MKNFLTNPRRILLAAVCITILTFFILPWAITQCSFGWRYNAETGVIGDTIGGTVGPFVGFIGAILTFCAFYIQYKANQDQREALDEQKKALDEQKKATEASDRQLKVQQIENSFFELLKIHRENVSAMSFSGSSGREVIEMILEQIYEILDIVNREYNQIITTLLPEYQINLAYLTVFFGPPEGVGKGGYKSRLNIDRSKLYGLLNRGLNYKKAEFVIEHMKAQNVYLGHDYFNGHESRLGHYYRHLFMIVNFIHKDLILTSEEKMKYIKILRGQLSNDEQILLFFNSVSDLGRSWELGAEPENNLITRYGLIKNISLRSLNRLNPEAFYPEVQFDDKPKG